MFTDITVVLRIEVIHMARSKYAAKTPLIGMCMVFSAMAIVAVTAYLQAGWLSIIGYAIAAAVGVFGVIFTFRDVSDPPAAPQQQQPRGPADGLSDRP